MRAAARLQKRHMLLNPRHGFYVAVPPQFLSWGAPPPDQVRGTPDAKAHPGREEVLAWAFERADGGRSFGFTGAHFHRNWGDENFRRLVVNAILWTAKVEVPPNGAKVDLDPADLTKNLDAKGRR